MPEVANWIGELTPTTGDGRLIVLSGNIESYAPFDSIGNGYEVWYAIIDGNNREAGIGYYIDSTFDRQEVFATLFNGAYSDDNPLPIALSGSAAVFCTFNKVAYERLDILLPAAANNRLAAWDDTLEKARYSPRENIQLHDEDVSDGFEVGIFGRTSIWNPNAATLNDERPRESIDIADADPAIVIQTTQFGDYQTIYAMDENGVARGTIEYNGDNSQPTVDYTIDQWKICVGVNPSYPAKTPPFDPLDPTEAARAATLDVWNCWAFRGDKTLRGPAGNVPLHADDLVSKSYVDALIADCCSGGNPDPVDPYPAYASLINMLPVSPTTWVRGFEGVVNDGTGQLAEWSDFNGLPEQVADYRGLLTLGGIDNETSIIECIELDPINSTWSFNTGPVTQSGGKTENVPSFTGWDLITLSKQFQCGVEVPGPSGWHVIGWPISYSIQSRNVYNQSTDPGIPSVADPEAIYRVAEYDAGGTTLFEETVTAAGNGASMTLPSRSGVIVNNNIYTYIQSFVQTYWAHDFGQGDIFITTDTYLSVKDLTPRMGKIGLHELGYQDHTITLFFQYSKAHPFGINVNSIQHLVSADQMNLLITAAGSLDWYTRNADVYTNINGSSLIEGTWYAVTLIQEAVTGQTEDYQHKAYINAIKVLDENNRVWEVLSADVNLFTGGTYLGFDTGNEAFAQYQRPVINGIAEYTMFDYALTEQQVIDQHNALLSA